MSVKRKVQPRLCVVDHALVTHDPDTHRTRLGSDDDDEAGLGSDAGRGLCQVFDEGEVFGVSWDSNRTVNNDGFTHR